MKDFEKELERSFRTINEGDIITGTVIGVTETEVTLDLNYYTQGIIKAENLSNDPTFSIMADVTVGDTIEATVIKTDDGHGNIELSLKEANDVLSWDKLKTMMDEETVVTVRIKEAVNAGVVTYLEGIRAFIPASQISADYVEDTSAWVGKEIEVKVITVDQSKEKLVLSGKSVARDKSEAERRHKISMLVPGTVVEGVVETIMPYGAFVSLGNGLSGLVHVSQICQKRISSPNEVLKVGQKIQAQILNTNDNKISLSMKVLEDVMAEAPEDAEVLADVEEYGDHEEIGTSLGSLFAGFTFED